MTDHSTGRHWLAPTLQRVPHIVLKDVGLVIPFFGERWVDSRGTGPTFSGSA
jgi:hypothetical protein